MTNETSARPAPKPTYQTGPPAAPYAAPARPPLSARQKKGAFWAGAVGFNLLTFGFGLVLIPIVTTLFGVFFAFLFDQIARNSDNLGTGFLAVRGFFASLNYGILAVIGVAIVLIGLAVMAGALFASKAILRSHGVNRVWAVTWAGAGIAIVASWIVGWIPGVIVQLSSAVVSQTGLDAFGAMAALGGLGLLLGIVTTAIIGWLAWWWMAHAFRAPAATDTFNNQPSDQTQG